MVESKPLVNLVVSLDPAIPIGCLISVEQIARVQSFFHCLLSFVVICYFLSPNHANVHHVPIVVDE